MIKVIIFVKRHPSLSVEAFHRHWREVHARLVGGTPSVARHIVRYEQNPRSAADYERDGDTGFDGVAIAWYRSRAAMEALFAEPEYLEKIRPDEDRLSDASRNVWIVCEDEHAVIG
ncbi:MAG: EthD domain-containing protein [Myxococcota bacterium]